MKVAALPREFVYNGTKLPDPDPAMSPEQVRDMYATIHGELATAQISGPDATGDCVRYTFHVAIGSKA